MVRGDEHMDRQATTYTQLNAQGVLRAAGLTIPLSVVTQHLSMPDSPIRRLMECHTLPLQAEWRRCEQLEAGVKIPMIQAVFSDNLYKPAQRNPALQAAQDKFAELEQNVLAISREFVEWGKACDDLEKQVQGGLREHIDQWTQLTERWTHDIIQVCEQADIPLPDDFPQQLQACLRGQLPWQTLSEEDRKNLKIKPKQSLSAVKQAVLALLLQVSDV